MTLHESTMPRSLPCGVATDIPRVSVIIPYHNEGALICRAIASINTQDYSSSVEIVVADDASDIPPPLPTDSRFPIRYVRSDESLYAGGTRNLGVSHSFGEYLCFLDADDEYLPERLKSQVDFLDANPSVSLVGGPSLIIHNGTSRVSLSDVVRTFYPEYLESSYVLPDTYRFHVCEAYPFHTGSFTIRRRFWTACGGFNTRYRWGEEIDLQVRLAQIGPTGYVPTTGMKYIQRSNSICSTQNPCIGSAVVVF